MKDTLLKFPNLFEESTVVATCIKPKPKQTLLEKKITPQDKTNTEVYLQL